MPIKPNLGLWLRYPWSNSIGTQLFLYVLSGALVGLGEMAYFFCKVSENRAKEQIQGVLNIQVQAIEGSLLKWKLLQSV